MFIVKVVHCMYINNGLTNNYSKTTIISSGFDVFKPCKLTVIIDCVKKTFDFYLNDELKAQNLKFRDSTASLPNKISFAPGNNNNTLTILETKVYKIEEINTNNTIALNNKICDMKITNPLSKSVAGTLFFITYQNNKIDNVSMQDINISPLSDFIKSWQNIDNTQVAVMLLDKNSLKPLVNKLNAIKEN